MTKLDEFKNSVKGKNITVIGIGISNLPLIKYLVSLGANVKACDKRSKEDLGKNYDELKELNVTFNLGDNYLEDIYADIIFKTPGMRFDNLYLLRAKEQGARITSEMEVFFDVCPSHIIAVTGSDGKTTTTTLIHKMMSEAGYRTWLGGNIGNPLLTDTEKMAKDIQYLANGHGFGGLCRLIGHHVLGRTGLEHAHGEYGLVKGIHPAGHEAFHVSNDLGTDGEGIHRPVGETGVTAAAHDRDVEFVGGSRQRAILGAHSAHRIIIEHMQAEEMKDPVGHAVFLKIRQHNSGTAQIGAFLCRLEHQQHIHRQLRLMLTQDAGRTQQHGRVAVMAASMHLSGDLRAVGNIILLLHRQGIHIRPQGHHAAVIITGDDAHHTHSGVDQGNAHLGQRFTDKALGVLRFKAHFRVHVQITAVLHRLCPNIGQLGGDQINKYLLQTHFRHNPWRWR